MDLVASFFLSQRICSTPNPAHLRGKNHRGGLSHSTVPLAYHESSHCTRGIEEVSRWQYVPCSKWWYSTGTNAVPVVNAVQNSCIDFWGANQLEQDGSFAKYQLSTALGTSYHTVSFFCFNSQKKKRKEVMVAVQVGGQWPESGRMEEGGRRT